MATYHLSGKWSLKWQLSGQWPLNWDMGTLYDGSPGANLAADMVVRSTTVFKGVITRKTSQQPATSHFMW